MKNLLSAAVLALGISLFSINANAQAVNGVNCSALSGTPMMCVKNMTSSPIVGIQAVSGNIFSPTAWINIPGGPILPGQTAIVRFNAWSGGCMQHVVVRTATGMTHSYPFTDVCHSTSFNVVGW